jgi:hypothetical protein
MTLPADCKYTYFLRHVDIYRRYKNTGIHPQQWVRENCKDGAIVNKTLGVDFCFSDSADALAFKMKFII